MRCIGRIPMISKYAPASKRPTAKVSSPTATHRRCSLRSSAPFSWPSLDPRQVCECPASACNWIGRWIGQSTARTWSVKEEKRIVLSHKGAIWLTRISINKKRINKYLLERLHGLMKQGSVSAGLVPGHSLSGSLAIVLENSRKILQWTSRSRVPSPQVTEHGLHSPAMKLSLVFVCFFCGNGYERFGPVFFVFFFF